jgi:nitrogen fixation NifU-like protein
MSFEIADLYQELIVDHSRRPRNFGPLQDSNHEAEGFNPLCGDRVRVFLKLEDNVLHDIRFEGEGCAISMASASLMTESVKGKTKAEVEQVFSRFHDLVAGSVGGDRTALGKLAVFEGLRGFPTRVKCATLVWHTLRAALEAKAGMVSTEGGQNESDRETDIGVEDY